MNNNLFKRIIENIDILTFLILSIFLSIIIFNHAINLPFSDQIDLFYNYFDLQSNVQLFLQQHGPHRQGLGAIIMYPVLIFFKGNFNVIVWINYIILIFSAIISILISRKLLLNKYLSTSIIYFILSYSASELITITPNISHSSLPILFSLFIFLIFQISHISLKYKYILIIMSLSLFTGFAIFLYLSLLFTILLNAFKFNKLIPNFTANIILFIFLNIGLLAIFFWHYDFGRGEGCLTKFGMNLFDYFAYASAVASIPIGGAYLGKLSIIFGGFLLITYLCIFIYTIRFVNSNNYFFYIPISIILLSSLLFIGSTSLGRHCLGLSSAYASRYYQFSSLGLVGILYFFGYSFLRNAAISILVAIISLSLVAMNIFFVLPGSIKMGGEYANNKINFIKCSRSNNIENCNELYKIYPPDSIRLQSILLKSKN